MIIVLTNWQGVLQVLFVSFTKGPGGFPYIFIITREVTTMEPILWSHLCQSQQSSCVPWKPSHLTLKHILCPKEVDLQAYLLI